MPDSVGRGIPLGQPKMDDIEEINEAPVAIVPPPPPPLPPPPQPAKRGRKKAQPAQPDAWNSVRDDVRPASPNGWNSVIGDVKGPPSLDERPVPRHRVTFKGVMGILEVSYHGLTISDAAICLLYDKRDVWATFYRPAVSIDPIQVVINDVTYEVLSLDIATGLDIGGVPHTMLVLLRTEFLFSRIPGQKARPAPAEESRPAMDPAGIMSMVPSAKAEQLLAGMSNGGLPLSTSFGPSFTE